VYELIYFTIPGLVATTITYFWFELPFSEAQTIAFLSTSPIFGYAAHQLFRLFFEVTGNRGHWRESRTVITEIIQVCSKKKLLERQTAFLIWEISIYDEKISDHFLKHDARMWRFIISHWSLAFVSLLLFSALGVIGLICIGLANLSPAQVSILAILSIAVVLFRAAGYQVLDLLNIQEVAYFSANKNLFEKASKSLGGKSKLNQD